MATLRNQLFVHHLKLYILAGIVGLVSGITAIAFRLLILGGSIIFLYIPQVLGIWGWIIAPTIGGLLVAIIVVKYSPEARGHGVPEVMDSYITQGGRMRIRVPILKSIASALSIASGGSCGREGPIAQIGAGMGSTISELLKLDRKQTRTLLVCGVASGISATFNSPLGGALFGIEIIAGGVIGFSIIPIILSSVIATAVTYAFLGTGVSFQAPQFTFGNPIELLFYLLLGLVFGVLSVIWTRGFYVIEDIFERIKTNPYLIPGIGGLATGILLVITIYFENVLSYSGVFAPGDPYYPAIGGIAYAFTDATLIGSVGLAAMVIFGFFKGLATAFTLGSGGSGGIFAPSLTMGAAFGGAMGLVFAAIVPWAVPQPMAFALVGMAALFAGSARAPMTCIVMLMEMTRDYSMILPLMIAVSSAFLVSSVLEEESIYTMKLARRGIRMRQGHHISALQEVCLAEIMTKNPTILRTNMTQAEVIDIIDETQHTKYPVLDENDNLVGTLIAEDLFHGVGPNDEQPLVSQMMNTNFLALSETCKMDSVLHEMMQRDEGHAVIVDSEHPNKMIGFVTKADVLRAYEIAIFRLQQQGVEIDDIGPADIIDVP